MINVRVGVKYIYIYIYITIVIYLYCNIFIQQKTWELAKIVEVVHSAGGKWEKGVKGSEGR